MYSVIKAKYFTIKPLIICIGIASFLQWLIYELLKDAKLGATSECFALAQAIVVFMVAPYSGALAAYNDNQSISSLHLLLPYPLTIGDRLIKRLFISQIPLFFWVFLSIIFSLFLTEVTVIKSVMMWTVLTVYTISAGAIGMCGAKIFRDVIFGSELSYLLWFVLIGSPFLLMPLERYSNNFQSYIQPVLHLNPLIAICYIFDGMDIFRTPFLYELTPITSYNFAYPPWYINVLWITLIGSCCFLLTWQIYRFNKNITVH